MDFGSSNFIPNQSSGPGHQQPNLMGSGKNPGNCVTPLILVIVAVSLILPFLMLSIFVFNWGTDLPIIGNFVTQGTVIPPGNPESFDPIATFAEVQAYAGPNSRITSMTADLVNSDGTLNLKAKYGTRRATVTYDFFNQLSEPPADAPPIGAGGSPDGKWYEPVRVTITQPGENRYMHRISQGYSFKGNYLHQGMEKSTSPAVGEAWGKLIDAPTCPFKPFWDKAIELRAPKEALASITYSETGYRFSIDDTNIDLQFGLDCQII